MMCSFTGRCDGEYACSAGMFVCGVECSKFAVQCSAVGPFRRGAEGKYHLTLDLAGVAPEGQVR
jgi:hypothetical protein